MNFFFFKQKTAYEMLRSLVGSEMCIRDRLKPSALKEYIAGRGIEVAERLQSYCSDDDSVYLEDMSGRVALQPNCELLPASGLVTGLVCALKGTISNGEFVPTAVCWPSVDPTRLLPNVQEDMYVALVSGLSIGSKESNTLCTQMMVEYLTGRVGGDEDIQLAASVCRVIVAGNSLASLSDAAVAPKAAGLQAHSVTDIAIAANSLDSFMLDLCSSVQVDIMAGGMDPSDFTMPQQPLSRCLFPKSSELKSLSAVTNPYHCEIGGRTFLGTSGQSVDHLQRFTAMEEHSPTDLLASCLKWRTCLPTAPESTACYPFKDQDPFLIDEMPSVMFAGNQPEFGERMVDDTRVISVPDFSKTGSIVLLNLKNLECECITFEA
eukprot:TRINITY_DN37832_c0_g1_i1.p1 TRINITY_DN37832_c0_g1~~TRINITY_DN37832_c0_g1_i1.p1  ORF type:complete len:378 (-),score=101.19 TRINITY_DN37832_c0_g1_i1:142-1275(-)